MIIFPTKVILPQQVVLYSAANRTIVPLFVRMFGDAARYLHSFGNKGLQSYDRLGSGLTTRYVGSAARGRNESKFFHASVFFRKMLLLSVAGLTSAVAQDGGVAQQARADATAVLPLRPRRHRVCVAM